jgi:hypothetical protein
VVSVENGVVRVKGSGSTTVSATLVGIPVMDALFPRDAEITVSAFDAPTTPAHTPTLDPVNVISIYSDAYTDVPVLRFSTEWDDAEVVDLQIQGDNVKGYSNLGVGAIEFTEPTIDASQMTHFHMDIFVPDGPFIKVKLVDYGEDGIYQQAPDSECDRFFAANTTPVFNPGEWVCLDVPLTDYMGCPEGNGLFKREHLAQLIITGTSVAFVDNIYFHD